MARRVVRLGESARIERLSRTFDRIRKDVGAPDEFPAEVLAAAERAATSAEPGPDDLRDIDFVTIDPPGSTDLDQAVFLERRDGGFHVDYAIADVPAFVEPGGSIAGEALRRGETLYAPDGRIPLHPAALSEAAASLLPDADRLAFVWRFELDDAGTVERVDLARGLVRSRLRLDYQAVQAAADNGAEQPLLHTQAALLRDVGRLRVEAERARGGASLPMPEQDVVTRDGRFAIVVRPKLPAEEWNAQISLMTGMAAATIMLDGGTGLLRTMPAPEPDRVAAFRLQARRLGVPWDEDTSYGSFIGGLDAAEPTQLALIHAAAGLFRGAGYTPVGSPDASRSATSHAAVAAPYAHVTAPLRRLVDRFGLVSCYHLLRGEAPPSWVSDGIGELPERMRASGRLASELDRGCLDVVEAAVLDGSLGEVFDAVVVDVRHQGAKGTVQLVDPPVLASCTGPLELGARLAVRLLTCDVDKGDVTFEAGGDS